MFKTNTVFKKYANHLKISTSKFKKFHISQELLDLNYNEHWSKKVREQSIRTQKSFTKIFRNIENKSGFFFSS